MKLQKWFLWFSIVGTVLLTGGCATEAHYIDPSGPEALVTVSGVDPAEWIRVANEGGQSLIASGALKRTDGARPVVMIGRIRNYTMLHLDIAILTGKLRETILQSHQAAVSSAVGYGGNVDLSVRRIRAKELDDLFDQSTVQKRGTVIAPNFSLSGMILQQNTVSGRTEESYYLFHLILTDLTTGIAVWEENIEFAKQATRPIL